MNGAELHFVPEDIINSGLEDGSRIKPITSAVRAELFPYVKYSVSPAMAIATGMASRNSFLGIQEL